MNKFFEFLKSIIYAIIGFLIVIGVIGGIFLFFFTLISFGGTICMVGLLVAIIFICFDSMSEFGKNICGKK